MYFEFKNRYYFSADAKNFFRKSRPLFFAFFNGKLMTQSTSQTVFFPKFFIFPEDCCQTLIITAITTKVFIYN